MKMTFDIDNAVMQRLRAEAARRGTTVSDLVEAGLRHMIDDRLPAEGQSAALPPLPSWRGGGELGDISNRDKLYRVMEEE